MFSGFKIERLPSIYNNKTVLNEYIPDNRLNALIQHNIGIEFSENQYQRKHYNFTNELAYYNTLLGKYNKKDNCFKIKLKNALYNWGRIQAEDYSTLAVFHRPTRHSLCQDQYKDIDMKSCCQTIFLNLVRMNGISHNYPRLEEYVAQRDQLLSHYQDKYGVSKNTIKNLFTGIGFGGSAKTWFAENNIEFDNDSFICELNAEYYKLADIIYDANKNICEDILKAFPNKFADYDDPSALISKKKRTTMAMFYQTAERYCQEAAISFLCDSKGFNIKDIVPCQDGFMVLASLMYPTICNDCEKIVKNRFKIEVQFIEKEFNERFEIPKYISDKDKQLALKQQQKEERQQKKEQQEAEREQKKKDKKEQQEATKQSKEIEKERKREEKESAYLEKDKKILLETIAKYTTEDGRIILPAGIQFTDDIEDSNTKWLLDGCMTDLDAAKKLFELYPHWITCQGEMYVFDYTSGMYSSNTIIYNKIIAQHSDFLHIMLKDETHNKDWYRSDCRSYGNTSVMLDKIITLLKTLNINNDWLKQSQSSSLGKILFENGYYDFMERKFYDTFNSKYVFFGKIHHKFQAFLDEDLEYMESIKQRLFYNSLGKEVGDYFILQLARGLSGECMKRMLFAIGDTNCGKGVITSATSLSIGDYFGSFNAESIAHRETSQDEAQIMRWVMLLRYKRIIISNEMKSGITLNGNFIKKIASGGDPLIGRTHCKEETEFNTHFLPIALDNDMSKITPYDDAVDTRVRCLTFNKSFVDREPENELELKMDLNIKEELKDLRFQRCFVGILLKAHCDYLDNEKKENEPEGVKNSKKDLIETTTDKNPLNVLLRDYEITNNDKDSVKSSELQDWLDAKKLGISITRLGRELNKYATINKLENLKHKDKKVAGKTSKYWFGIKEKEIEDEEEQ
jgi:hypothetical protein